MNRAKPFAGRYSNERVESMRNQTTPFNGSVFSQRQRLTYDKNGNDGDRYCAIPSSALQVSENNTLCIAVDIERVLHEDELTLVRQVGLALDRTINIVAKNRMNGMKVIIVYDSRVSANVITGLKSLIFGLSKLDYNTNQNKDGSICGPDAVIPASVANKDENLKQPDAQINTNEEEETENPNEFIRPLSLKGQRHVFLYKCRYSQLQSIIDKNNCWGLRMASLEEKWPCLVVYSAKDRESWMGAFRKIQKLERSDFVRKRISDSLKNVDLKKLEDLTQQYGEKNACIALCVQSPSSPQNPSVSVCGLSGSVEQLYKIFVEYHLVTEEDTDTDPVSTSQPSTNMMYNTILPPYQSQSFYPYGNDIFLRADSHPLYAPFSSSAYASHPGIAENIHDTYNTTLNNPHLDNYPYSSLPQHMMSKPFSFEENSYALSDHYFDEQFMLDNDYFFDNPGIRVTLDNKEKQDNLATSRRISNRMPSESTPIIETNKGELELSSQSKKDNTSRLPHTNYTEFIPSKSRLFQTNSPNEKEDRVLNSRGSSLQSSDSGNPLPGTNIHSSGPGSASNPSSISINRNNMVSKDISLFSDPPRDYSAGSLGISNPLFRRHDDNFELFLNNGGVDSIADPSANSISIFSQWRDEGWSFVCFNKQ